MKAIRVDDKFYSYIASYARYTGENTFDILRRMLKSFVASQPAAPVTKEVHVTSLAITEAKPVKTIKDKTRTVRELLLSDEYAEQRRAVNRFMLPLSTLYSPDAQVSVEVTKPLHGCTCVYFTVDEQTLPKNGSQTKPKYASGTPYWVITNINTGRKCSMIEYITQSTQFPAGLIEKVCGTI